MGIPTMMSFAVSKSLGAGSTGQISWGILYSGGDCNVAKKTEEVDQLQLLKQAIRSKAPERLYFFHGEESFLMQHYLEQLRKLGDLVSKRDAKERNKEHGAR